VVFFEGSSTCFELDRLADEREDDTGETDDEEGLEEEPSGPGRSTSVGTSLLSRPTSCSIHLRVVLGRTHNASAVRGVLDRRE